MKRDLTNLRVEYRTPVPCTSHRAAGICERLLGALLKAAETSESRRCVLSKQGGCHSRLLLRGFLSGFFLHVSFYLGFVRLSRCLPFFLLVGSKDAVDIVDVLLSQLYDLRLLRVLVQCGIVFKGLEVGNVLVNDRLSLVLLIGAESDLFV